MNYKKTCNKICSKLKDGKIKPAQSEFTISGQVNYPSHLYANGNVEMIVVFHPYALKAFLNLPISLLHNQEVSQL